MNTDGLKAVAERHGFSAEAAEAAARALEAANGKQAQFSHPELGGMGQWMPGMTMIGKMGDADLKRRVDALFADLAKSEVTATPPASEKAKSGSPGWWPAELGASPAVSGAQNNARYAWFAETKRLAVEEGGSVAVYDTEGHRLTSVSQQQSDATRTLSFRTADGSALDIASLRRVS